MKNKTASVKKFARKHKSALIVAAVTIPVIVLQQKGISSLNAYLEEKGLLDEYYFVEED